MPIVIFSATADKAIIVRALESGADDYIIKPPDPVEFTTRLKARLDDEERFAK